MPEWFASYLESLTDEQAEELWRYIDSEPDAVAAMIGAIAEGHSELDAKGGPKWR